MGASLHSFTHPTNNVDHSHGITREKVFYGIYSSVCFRGNHIRLYQIEAVLADNSMNNDSTTGRP
jgi:hypothetical protein